MNENKCSVMRRRYRSQENDIQVIESTENRKTIFLRSEYCEQLTRTYRPASVSNNMVTPFAGEARPLQFN
jgi:hypothetical protein